MSKSLANTLNFEGVVPRACWADTCFENQLLYLLEINALTGLLTDIYKRLEFLCQIFLFAGRWQLRRNIRHKVLLGCHCSDPWMYPLSPKNTVLLEYTFPFKFFPSTEIWNPWKTPRILRYWTSDSPWTTLKMILGSWF